MPCVFRAAYRTVIKGHYPEALRQTGHDTTPERVIARVSGDEHEWVALSVDFIVEVNIIYSCNGHPISLNIGLQSRPVPQCGDIVENAVRIVTSPQFRQSSPILRRETPCCFGGSGLDIELVDIASGGRLLQVVI
jgi:hypothetical protein